MKKLNPYMKRALFLFVCAQFFVINGWSRLGGGGGRNSHSSSSHSSSHSSHSYGNGGSSGGSIGFSGLIFLLVIGIVGYIVWKRVLKPKMKGMDKNNLLNKSNLMDTLSSGSLGGIVGSVISELMDNDDEQGAASSKPFPQGLTQEKVSTAFMELQQAWQNQDLSKVRKWMSDGMYQRLTAQFGMMRQLTQRNRLSNIRISRIAVANVIAEGHYQCADVAITFNMNDEFICEKYPSLNESFYGDSDTEYWTFIKRKDAESNNANADLYNSDNCPNCGASLENKLGEVSRCPSCNTLTNNAAYDWVLSEITQMDDYAAGNRLLQDEALNTLTQNDPLFAIQRMEDIASNVFMQIMEVLTGSDENKLNRFANDDVKNKILQYKAETGNFVFDRLYLNEVTLTNYDTNNSKFHLHFRLGASYQRVQVGDRLKRLDREISIHHYTLTLSKDIASLNEHEKEIAFSYECANCGAPYDDTTNDTCGYCGASMVDSSKNWVLTAFEM